MDNFGVIARELLRGVEDQIDKGIDEEDTRKAVNTLADYFTNVDLHVDLNEKEATVGTVTS